MKLTAIFVTALLVVAIAAPTVLAFCGFYVAKADTKLFNQASQVVLVRNENKTVITMANDFKGDPQEFAVVVPVPTVLDKGKSGSPIAPSSSTSMRTRRPASSSTSTKIRASRSLGAN